jgi:hypothetical protein
VGLRILASVVSLGLSILSRLRGRVCFEAVAMLYAVDQRPDGDQDSRNEYEREPQRSALVFAAGIELLIWRKRPLPGEQRCVKREQSTSRVV